MNENNTLRLRHELANVNDAGLRALIRDVRGILLDRQQERAAKKYRAKAACVCVTHPNSNADCPIHGSF